MRHYSRTNKKPDLVKHRGVFFNKLSMWEGVAIIMSGTIGAGVLGIPFAIEKVGLGLGIICIVIIGFLMIGLNLLVGEIALAGKTEAQLVGMAKKHLGKWGEWLMTVLMYMMLFGVLVVYIIGEGETLSTLFGGSSFMWSFIFFAVASLLIYIGLRTLKTIELLLSIGILVVVLLIAAFSAPHIELQNLTKFNIYSLFVPYGVLLFAFHGATSVPEAFSVLKNKETSFKKAIILSGLITIIVYTLFAFVTVGVLGSDVTEIATIGLGNKIGPWMFILGNVFAVIAMGTSFLMAGLALRDSMRWDFKMNYGLSTLIVCGVPFIIFLLGLRHFVLAIDIVGGVFMSLEILLILYMYFKFKKT